MPPPIRPFVPIALYEGALDALPAGVLVFHLDVPDDPGSLRLLYANPSATRVVGLDFEAHLGETLRDFMPGLLETELPAQYAHVARTGEDREIGDVTYGDDGVRPGIYNVRAFGLPDQSVGLLLEDVSEKRRLDAEREEEREFLGAVLENVSDGIVACNSAGELTLFNRATREFHGLPAEPIPAGAWAEHYSLHRADGTGMPTDEIPLLRALHGEVLRDEPMRIVPKEGAARTLLASGRPLANAAGEPLGAVVAMRDVTANEQAQAEVLALVATQRELEEQARTLETINRVNASLAAELEPEGLVQAVTDAGTELTEAQFGAFFYNVVNRAGESYMLYTISGVPREAFSKFPMPRNTDVFHATFSGEGVVRLDDVTTDPRYGNNPPYHGMPAGHLPVRSYLAVPVKSSEGQVIGGLFFGHEEPGVFDERAEQIALALADQAAIALQNARLYAALQAELADRRQVEGALRESESRYRALIQAAPDVVFAYTLEEDGRPGPFLEFNDAALRTYGYTREEVARLTPADLVAPDARGKIDGRIERLRAEGQVLFETAHVTKNGREIPMEASAQFFQLDGRDAVLAVCRDVTDRRDAENAVRRALAHAEEAERQLLAVVDNLPELAWTAGPDGTIDFYNRRWYEYTGTTPGEMAGGGWHAVHDPAVLPAVLERWRHSVATGEPFEMEYPLRGADGTFRWFLTRVQALRDASGKILRWVGTNANIDEQRRLLAERDAVLERLAASERQFRLLTDAVPQLIWTASAEGTPDFYNERWYSYTGMARPDAAGAGLDTNWGDYVHPDDREGAFAAFGRAAAAAAPFEYEYRFRSHDGRYRWFLGRALPTLDAEGQVTGWVGSATDIQERKALQQELEVRVAERTAEAQAAAERLDAVLNGTTDLIAAVDTEYRVLAFNQGFSAAVEAVIGKPLALGMTAEDLLPDQPEEWARSKAEWSRVLAGESFTKLEKQDYPGLGRRAFESYYSPIRSAEGAVTGGVCVVRDVTEREQAAQSVEAFAQDLRALHTVVTADHETTEELLRDYLRAGSAIFDLPHGIISETPRDEETGRRHYRIRAVVSPDPAFQAGATLPLSETFCDRVVDEEATVAFADAADTAPDNPACAERGLHAFIGTPIYVGDALVGTLNFSSPEPRAEGFAPHEVELIELMAEFVGRQLAVEQALHAERQAEARYRTLVEALDEGVVLQDADGTAVAWNEAAMRVLGSAGFRTPGTVGLGSARTALRDDGTTFPPEAYPAAVALRTGEPQRNVLMGVQGRGGDLRWLSVNAVPLREGAGGDADEPGGDGATTGVVTSFMDVTALKDAEAALHRRSGELEERNAELEQFAYVASHDLQEPLRTVASFLQLLERRYAAELDDRAREYIAFAVDGSRRMQALIQGLLAYSRIGTRGRPFEPVDAGAVLRDVLVDLGPALGEAEADVRAGDLPTICADPTQLHQLLLNLVSNAVKFQREGVPPRVEISAREVRDGGTAAWAFSVADNGIGLEQKYADRVFQLFQRLHTRDEFPGTGIGLAVCKKIVERHGGVLGYSGSPGGGTTFSFTLPIRPLDGCDGPPEPAGHAPAPAE